MATNFLWYAGSGNNGQLVSPFNILTTELNGITTTSVAPSTVIHSTGIVSNSDTGQGVWGEIFFTSGGAVTGAAGANVCGWFLASKDGSTFEPTAAAPARPPDFIIPTPTTLAAATYKAAGLIRLPVLPFKVILQNNVGGTLYATGNIITLAPVAIQY